ncbi:hypothetical protein Ahy_A09g043051 isoform F [Arachis hypogaea]|uniref:Tuberculostearic acid methyltransferase n=1 Tax=Arachis hypogaea TaxID=3818 RepID=A0A445BHE0_ARAHY|nr:hypothetical protein Ahy_A09g043051 isoform F [Arachis hypogaea]
MIELFENFGVDMKLSDMSFAISLDGGRGYEWGSRNGLSGLFAQKKNVINPHFWQMLRNIINYLDMLDNNLDMEHNETLEQFIKTRGYSKLFVKAYLIPICGSIWPCSFEGVMSFSAFSVFSFFRNHHHLQLFGRSQWLTVKRRSHTYIKKVKEELVARGGQAITNCEVELVSTTENGCLVHCKDGSKEMYDCCIIATHAPGTLILLGEEATYDERRILGAFQYAYSDTFLHHDKNLMPQNPSAWSAWNFLGCNNNNKVCVTFWLNILQNLGETRLPFLITLNPNHTPKSTLLKWSTKHPVPSVAAFKASYELEKIQGKRGIWFCGAYQGCGFHEDGLKSGMIAANAVLGRCCSFQTNPKHMVPSWKELSARFYVTRFLSSYVNTGCLTLLEEGGTMFTFEGTDMKCSLKCVMRIHSPQFYWKVMTQADLGLADAYINGDFSLIDKDEGLLNLILIILASRDSNASNSKLKNRAMNCLHYSWVKQCNIHVQCSRQGSNFLILESIFLNEDEDLKTAQMRKLSLLIEKARIDKKHEILEIGCGWGGLAIEIVKQTGCKYTGITLSKEQLKFAKRRARDVGLQDHIKFLLCDYRQLPNIFKYDRIISWVSSEMIEAVGHEYMEEFFGCCESVLADDGLFVLQFSSVSDDRYDEYRRCPGFIKEYIFPGGCLPSLSRVISAMVATSKLCVEHTENIGIHFHQTLRWWSKNFMEKQSEILALGFDEKFIKTWKYYFDYCAAGFKSRTLENYQMVFSRPNNTTTLKDPYRSWPSAC